MIKAATTILTFAFLFSSASVALTLNDYLEIVKKNNKIFAAYEASLEAANDKLVAGDLVLNPALSAGYTLTSDESQPSSLGTKRETQKYTLGVSKKFSTGTSVQVSATTLKADNTGVAAPSDKYSAGGLGLSLTQSLWKDFFGQGTRLRQEREAVVNQLDRARIDLQVRAALYDAESVFWEYAFAQEDLKLKKANLERAKKMERWTSNRVSNGISDRADLMNVRALAALREVQYATTQDDLKVQELKLREYMNLEETQATPVVVADMVMARLDVAQLSKNKKDIVQIDKYLSSLEAKTRQFVADEVRESLRPDLLLSGSYNTNSYDRDYNQMTSNMTKTDTPTTVVGLTFSWMFDTDAKSAQLSSATKDALAAKYTAERNLVLGRIAWQDLLRKYELTKRNVLTLEKVAEFQRERAKAEQDKFNKGRTITATVVTAETEAAEAEVNLLRAKSGLRKLEASSNLFIGL